MNVPRPPHLPIRVRLALAVGLVALLVLSLIDLAVYRRTETHLMASLDASLREEAGEMVPLLDGGRPIADLAPLLHDDDEGMGVLLLQAFDGRGDLIGATPAARGLVLVPDATADLEGDPVFAEVSGVGQVRLLAFNAVIDDRPYTLVVGASFAPTARTLASLRWRLVGGTLLGGLLMAVLAYGLTAVALRPVDKMRRRAQDIRSSQPGIRLPLPAADDEVRRLGETLNHTFDDLEAAAARRRMFVAHASHELRTPLTRLRTNLELAGRPHRTAEELRDAVTEAAVDTEELIALADGLLDLGRLEADPVRPIPAPCDVAEVVRALADSSTVVQADTPGAAWVRIERGALGRVLSNLVTNAEVHGAPPIEIEVEARPEWVTITVRDHGSGMPEGFETAAFEPFTRAPGAGERPGAGMGLAIVVAIADRHGGTCSVQRDGSGFGLRVDLPAACGPDEEDAQPRNRNGRTGSVKPLTSVSGRASTASGPAAPASDASTRTSPGSARLTSRAARLTTEP